MDSSRALWGDFFRSEHFGGHNTLTRMTPARRLLPRSGDNQVASQTLDRQLLVADRRRHQSERFDARYDLRSSNSQHVIGTDADSMSN